MLSLHQRQLPEMASPASTSPRCELCPAKPLVYCPADQAFLCRDCDDRVHSANFIVLRHTRTALCQTCYSETGLRIQGARSRMQCFDAYLSLSSEYLAGLPAMVPVISPPEGPLCLHCSPTVPPCHSTQRGSKSKMLQSMGLPVPAALASSVPHIQCSAGLGESCTTAAHRNVNHPQKRRRNSKHESANQEPDVVLRLASGLASRDFPGAKSMAFTPLQLKEAGSFHQDQWLRLSVDPESALLESGRNTPSSSGCVTGLETNSSCRSESQSSSSFQQEGGKRMRQTLLSTFTTPSGVPNSSSVSSVASCSFTSSLSLHADAGFSLVPTMKSQTSCTKPKARQGVKRKEQEESSFKAEEGKSEASPAAPLGRPASSRLRRVLKSWSVSLGGINMSTQNLAYELFQRSLLKMKRGEVAANFLRLTLAACLWLSTKLVELRAQVPGAKEVATVTAVESKDLKSAEITVMKLLDWQPLKHVTEQVKAKALGHKKDV